MMFDFTSQDPHLDIFLSPIPWLRKITPYRNPSQFINPFLLWVPPNCQGSKLEEVFEESDVDGNHVLQNDEETTFEPGSCWNLGLNIDGKAEVNLVKKIGLNVGKFSWPGSWKISELFLVAKSKVVKCSAWLIGVWLGDDLGQSCRIVDYPTRKWYCWWFRNPAPADR